MKKRYRSSGYSGGGGMSLLGVLQVVFIVLKLVGVITWSWWLVFIPLFLYIALNALLVLLLFILELIYE